METVTAKISGIRFQNRATGFYVLVTTPDGGGQSVTVRGTFPGVGLSVGLKATFTGSFEEHSTYGRQLAATSCQVIPEKGRNGVVAYLTTHVQSIGPVTAAKLYDALGDDLLRVMESEPDKLRSLDFLTSKQVDAIVKEWSEASEVRNSTIYLSGLGLTSSQIRSVYTKLGAKTREIVAADPYKLYECPGVGFASSDSVARRLGVGVDDPRRIQAMIMFVLDELAASDGHMYASSKQILAYVAGRMFRRHSLDAFSHGDFMSDSHFYAGLTALVSSGHVVSDSDRIYLAQNFANENGAASCLAKMLVQPPRAMGDIGAILADFELKKGIDLSDDQRRAFRMLERSRVSVITGFPGTGKTTMISAFVHLFETTNMHFVLMSPTGIAAKRLSQVTGKPASTIHRALGFKKDGTWEFNPANKFHVDAVIVDEMSMVDASILNKLVSSLPETTILVMIGDPRQLPSVGAGYVLHSLMSCPDVPHVSLTRIYRQHGKSDIVSVAHAILRGETIDTSFNKDSEFVFLQYPQEQVADEIMKLASAMKARNMNFQVIAPMYDGELGVNSLNRDLRDVLNPDYANKKASHVKIGDAEIYEGDRVMIVKNDYDRMVYNGETGKVHRINLKDDAVEVKVFNWFDAETSTYCDKIVSYKIEEARQMLRVAYACTAHKVQGQEFDYVVLPMTMQYGIMLYRNLVYTAVTRAKKKVFVLGDHRAFATAVRNDRETIRNSNLNELVAGHVRSATVSQVQES